MMTGTRYIRFLDWVDNHIVRHRSYRFCVWVCSHPDWEKQ